MTADRRATIAPVPSGNVQCARCLGPLLPFEDGGCRTCGVLVPHVRCREHGFLMFIDAERGLICKGNSKRLVRRVA